MRKFLFLICLGVLCFGYWKWSESRETPPGALLKTAPEQVLTFGVPIKVRNYTLFTLAKYQIDARVLGTRSYQGDEGDDLSPLDFALGWGPMADQEILTNIRIWQKDRFYYWEAMEARIPGKEIIKHSANVHLIPATPELSDFLKTIRIGERICLQGRLVSVNGPDGMNWKSSLSRTDSGAGSCELLYVENATRLDGSNKAKTIAKSYPRPAPTTTETSSKKAKVAKPVRTITVHKSVTVKLKYGVLTIPQGGVISIIDEQPGKLKASYGGHEFWVDMSNMPES